MGLYLTIVIRVICQFLSGKYCRRQIRRQTELTPIQPGHTVCRWSARRVARPLTCRRPSLMRGAPSLRFLQGRAAMLPTRLFPCAQIPSRTRSWSALRTDAKDGAPTVLWMTTKSKAWATRHLISRRGSDFLVSRSLNRKRRIAFYHFLLEIRTFVLAPELGRRVARAFDWCHERMRNRSCAEEQELRRQHRHPPLQKTQGWGTLRGNGAINDGPPGRDNFLEHLISRRGRAFLLADP